MRVYSVASGCIHEGGSLRLVTGKLEEARQKAAELRERDNYESNKHIPWDHATEEAHNFEPPSVLVDEWIRQHTYVIIRQWEVED